MALVELQQLEYACSNPGRSQPTKLLHTILDIGTGRKQQSVVSLTGSKAVTIFFTYQWLLICLTGLLSVSSPSFCVG